MSATAVDTGSSAPRVGGDGGDVGGLEELAQALRIVLGTRKKSVPGMPWFGSDLDLLVDLPISIARPRMVREAARAVALCEPRVTVKGVNILPGDAGGRGEVEVSWQPASRLYRGVDTTQRTRVRL